MNNQQTDKKGAFVSMYNPGATMGAPVIQQN
jgi:hypothetical protein